MPFARKEALVAAIVPHRRRRLAFLAQRIDGHYPVTRLAAAALVAESCRFDRLVGHAHDVPGPLELVDAVSGDALFGTRVPLELGHAARGLAAEDVGRLGGDCQRVRRWSAF